MSEHASTAATTTLEQDAAAPSFHGDFIWYELLTSDRDAAIDFYKTVVGWTAADFPTPVGTGNFRYTILSVGDRGVAGVMVIDDEMRALGRRPGWLGIIGAADTDAAAKRIADAGGTVHKEPADIPTIGRFAIVADPGGAVFQLLTPIPPEKEPAPLDPQTPGKVSWHELYTSQGQAAAFEFYSGRFGWKTFDEMDMGPMGKYRIFGKDDVQMGGMMDKPADMPVSAWLFYVNVDGIDAAVDRIKAHDGQVLNGPMEVPGGSWIVQAVDPQGASFALVSAAR